MLLCRQLSEAIGSKPLRTYFIGYKYHIPDLLKRGKSQNLVKVYPPALHLFIHKILQQKQFIQSNAVITLIETQKIHVDPTLARKLVSYLVEERVKIMSIESVSNILTTMYHIGYQNKEDIIKMGLRIFALTQADQEQLIKKSFSVYMMRSIVSLHLLVGIKNFSADNINNIDIKSFKPLYLFFFLEILKKEGLEDLKMFDHILDSIIEYQPFIPFSDLHHLRKLKWIQNDKLATIIQNLQEKFMSNMGSQDSTSFSKINNGASHQDQLNISQFSKELQKQAESAKEQVEQIKEKTQVNQKVVKQDIDPELISRLNQNYLGDLYKRYF